MAKFTVIDGGKNTVVNGGAEEIRDYLQKKMEECNKFELDENGEIHNQNPNDFWKMATLMAKADEKLVEDKTMEILSLIEWVGREDMDAIMSRVMCWCSMQLKQNPSYYADEVAKFCHKVEDKSW